MRALCLIVALTACGDPSALAVDTQLTRVAPIIGGEAIGADEFPATGALLGFAQGYNGPTGGFSCTATLIAPDLVLTAGHCTEGPPPYIASSFELWFSLGADVSAFGEDDNWEVPYPGAKVAAIIAHPDWPGSDNMEMPNGLADASDIGLLVLEDPIVGVEPVVLGDPAGADAIEVGAAVDIAGYGQTVPTVQTYPPPLAGIKYAAESVIHEVGAAEMQIGEQYPTPQKCYGDSGGPTFLTIADDRTPAVRQIGITSRGYDQSEDCYIGGVDTRVDHHWEWIRQTAVELCTDGVRVSCAGGGALPTPAGAIVEPDPSDPDPDPSVDDPDDPATDPDPSVDDPDPPTDPTDGADYASPGAERGPCYDDGTCDAGLTCLSSLCVVANEPAPAGCAAAPPGLLALLVLVPLSRQRKR